MTQTLYQRIKECLPAQKFMVSDRDSIMLNMRDFHINQISPVHATLRSCGLDVGYPFRVLLSFLDTFAYGLVGKDFNIILADPSMGIAAYHVWLRAGGTEGKIGKIYAPKGMPAFPNRSSIYGDLFSSCMKCIDPRASASPDKDRQSLFTFVLGNTKTSEATLFAVDRFVDVTHGLLLLKDYAKGDAFDERDYLEKKQLFPAVTFEGHAFIVRF